MSHQKMQRIKKEKKKKMPPLRTDMPDFMGLVTRFVNGFNRRNIGTYASSTTYCMLLSFFPALILVASIIPYTSLSEADVIGFFLMVLPDASGDLIRQVCRDTYNSSVVALPLSIILMLWSAGFGMMQLTRGLNAINSVHEKRNYFVLRLTATLYTLLVLALMVATLLLQIFVRYLRELWESVLPGVEVPEVLTSALRYVVLFFVAVVLFVFLYTTLPATKKKLWMQLPGAIVAAAGWEVFSAFFTIYVNLSQNLSVYYGSLLAAVVLMLWLYWCLYILLVGAYLNHFLEVHVFSRTAPVSDPPRRFFLGKTLGRRKANK